MSNGLILAEFRVYNKLINKQNKLIDSQNEIFSKMLVVLKNSNYSEAIGKQNQLLQNIINQLTDIDINVR